MSGVSEQDRRPRVLWVTTEPPDRHLGGGSIRQAHLLDALVTHADVTLLLYGSTLRDERSKAGLAGLVEVPGPAVPTPGRPFARRLHDLREALFAADPPEVTSHRRIRRALRARWRELGDHDVVLVEHAGLAPLVELRGSERWLLTLHNVGSGTLDQQAALAAGRRRWIYARQANQARKFERRCLDTFDLVFTVSEADADLLPGPTTVIPNGVDVDRFDETRLPVEPRLALIGTLGYLPNVDGATWFVNEVFPLVRRDVADASVDLVGRLPAPEVLDLAARPGVSVYPDVPDVREYFTRARVCVVPLRLGTGTRLKALEAFAAGRPVVGTSVGLAGLDVEDGVHALVADDASGFAERVVALLTAQVDAETLVRNARELVEKKYSWAMIGDQFSQAVLSDDRPACR
jgi:glycosyltransferase involved in cell wall biosynthesis